MAKAFNLTAELNLRGPSNLKQIVGEIRRELGTVTADVKLQVDPKAATAIDAITKKLTSMNNVLSTSVANTNRLNTELKQLGASLGSIGNSGTKVTGSIRSVSEASTAASKATKEASTSMEEFGKQGFLAVKRFAAFSIAAGSIATLTRAVTSGFKAFVSFDKEIIKLRQVTGEGALGIKDLENEITRLSINLGISSESLIQTASTLAQAGLTAKETKIALEALAKTELAPSFDNIIDTTEGAIAAIRQFSLETTELESALGSINAVAAAFAVESGDIIAAIQRTGGVFASASRGVSEGTDALNEFVAIFTSVRATTRESAETIATGLRTIFTRIQRADTIKQLRGFGIELQDLEGKFVGPFEAIRRLSEGLANLDPRDIRFSSIVEELGGFRQIGKVIPLIQQFETAQKALGVAQRGQGSLTDAQIVAQQSLANQLARVREQFLALIRDIGQSKAFNTLFTIVTNLASGLISLAGAFKPIIPILGIIGAVKGVKALTEFGGGFFGQLSKAGARKTGSNIGGAISGTREKEKAETVSRANDLIKMNTDALNTLTQSINMLAARIGSRGSATLRDGGKVLAFNRGGVVPGTGIGDKVPAMLEPGEFVIRKKAVESIGAKRLHNMNKYWTGGVAESKKGGNAAPINAFMKQSGNYIEDNDKLEANITRKDPSDYGFTSSDFPDLVERMKKRGVIFKNDPRFAVLTKKEKGSNHYRFTNSGGVVFEEALQEKINSSRTTGLRTVKYPGTGSGSGNISNASVDLIDNATGELIESKFVDAPSKAQDAIFAGRLLRYNLENRKTTFGSTLPKSFNHFGEDNLNDIDDINLGSITAAAAADTKIGKNRIPGYKTEFNKWLIDNNYAGSSTSGSATLLRSGGLVQKFLDGGWVKRMQRYPDKELNEEMMYLYSILDLYDLGEGPLPANTFDNGKMEDIGKREARQRIKAIEDYIVARKEIEKQKFANRKGPGLQSTDQYDTQEMLDAITYYQAGSGPFTKALASDKKTFTDPRGERYQTQDIRDRLLAASQFKIPKKTYSGLGRSQLKEILSDTEITPKELSSKPSETLKNLVGKTVDFPTFLSVSADKSQAEAFVQNPGALLNIDGSSTAQKTIDIVKAKNKTKVNQQAAEKSRRLPGLEKISEKKLENYDEEKEFIIPPNVGFKITRASGTVSSSFSKDLKSKKPGGVGSTGGLSLGTLYELYYGEDDKEFEKTKLDLTTKMLRSGGKVKSFMAGGKVQRNLGYIDYDVIANEANAGVVEAGMKKAGVTGPRLYADYLTDLAVKARKSKKLDKLRAIYGVAGSGKTTLARGQGTDVGTLRETTRFPILTPEDIEKANEILILTSSVSRDKLEGFLSEVDRAYTLSSTTATEQERIKAQRTSRDTTGIGLEGRRPGTTSGVGRDTAVGEALLGDALGKRSVVLGRTESGRLRRKSGNELVEIIKKRIGFTWGGYAPTTAGHESIVDSAAAYGIPPEDFIALVGSDEGITKDKDGEYNYRTAIFDQDARILLAKAGFGSKGATVIPKPRDFEVPQGFDIGESDGRRRVVVPAPGSTAFVAEKTEQDLEKYIKAGYETVNLERSGGISGTLVRKLIEEGNLAELQKVLSPPVYDMISRNIGRIQNRASVLPNIIAEVEKNKQLSLKAIEQQIEALGISRINKTTEKEDPEYAAKAEVLRQLRDKRDKIRTGAQFEPYRLLAKLAAAKPDQYGLDFSTRPSATPLSAIPAVAKPSEVVAQKTKAKAAKAAKTATSKAKVGPKKVDIKQASMKMAGSELISRVGGISPAIALLQKEGFDLGKDKIQGTTTILRSNKAAKQVLIDAINAQYAATMGGISQKGLAFGAVGLAGNPYSNEVRVLSDRLKNPVTVNISGRLANDKFKALMQSQIDTGYESTIMGAAQQMTIAQILDDIVGGDKLISDFDKVINYGADVISSDPGAPMFSEFQDLDKVREALRSSSLSPFGQSLADLVKSSGSSELLNRMFINTARSQTTAPLIKEWLDSVGLPIPLENIYGVGGANVSGSSIPKLKAAIVQKLGGGSFVDDDPANVAGVAETIRGEGLRGKSYLMPYGQPKGSEANTAKGVLFQNILQELGAIRNTDRQSIDFPQGLGSQAAGLFNDGGMFVTLPTDAKYTLSGAGDMISNITNYLRAQGYMAGGAVKAPQRSFGTGTFPFPKRISNAYFKELDKMTSFEEFDARAGFALKDTTVRVDELGMREAYDSSPLDLERFKSSFKERLSRNTLISGMSDFAKFIGLPSESLIDYLPQVVDFDQPSGGISTAYFDPNPSLNRKAYSLENFGWSEAQEQDLYGIQALIKEKEKEIKRIIKKPVKTFEDGSFSYDYEAATKANEELRVLKDRLFNLKDAKLTAEKAARANAKSVAETTGRGTIGFKTKLSMFGAGAPASSLYHELGHQLLSTFKTRVPESFDKYKTRVVSLFDGDNDDVAQAIDALPGANYKSADIAYGRSYKIGALSSQQTALLREQKPENQELLTRSMDIRRAADAVTTAKPFKTLNPVVNSTLKMLGVEDSRINKLEDMGKEEFLTTLLQNYPILDSNLNGILQSTLDELFAAGGVQRQKFNIGGVVDKPKFSTKEDWIEEFKRKDRTNNTSSFDTAGNLLPHINDWIEEELKSKTESSSLEDISEDPLLDKLIKKKQSGIFGKAGIRSSGSEVIATYFKNSDRSGSVTAKKLGDNIFSVGLSGATGGFGPYLYELVIEKVSQLGGMLTPDRNMVSQDAQRYWANAFARSSIKKTPLDPKYWVKNNSLLDPKLYGKPETWPPANDPAWILQSGYSKNSQQFINDPDVVDLNDPKYSKFIQMQQASFLSRNMGGPIGRFSGGGVAAMVSNGEGFVPPTVAKKIGYAKLDRINQADRNGMRGFSGGGGISVFKGPGSGTSDSIGPISLPTGGYVIRKGAMDALGFSRGGNIGIRKFASGSTGGISDIGEKGKELQDKRFLLESKRAKRLQLEQQRTAASTPEEKQKITDEMESVVQDISQLEIIVNGIETEFNSLTDAINAFESDIAETGKVLRDSIRAEFEAITGRKPSDSKVEEILQEVTRTGGKARLDTGDDITVNPRYLQDIENNKKNLASRVSERDKGFGKAKDMEDFNISARDFISQKQSELSSEQKNKSELESRASTATGGEAILLNDQIKTSAQKIVELNAAIEAAEGSYSGVAAQVSTASKLEADAQDKVRQAEQNLLNSLRARVTDWENLSDKNKAKAIEQVRNTGQITDKSGKTQSFDISEVQEADRALELARAEKERAENKKETLYPSKPSATQTDPRILAEQQKLSDNAFFEYRAQTDGTNVRAVKLGIAKELGRARFEASGAQFEGRKAEASNKLFLQQDTLKNLAQTRAKAQATITSSGGTAEEKQAATVELASINQRLAAETDNIVQQMVELNPTLGDSEEKMKELRASAETVAESLGSGDLAAAQKAFTDAIGSAPEGADALRVAMLNTAKKLGISVDLLEREFGEAGDSAKEVARQSFVQSREGQRFGALAQFAPGMLGKFSESRGGRVLGAGADFISGKGGRFSQAFANVGGIAGVGAGATLIADQLQQGLKNYAPALSSNVNVAGAVGALGGAGTGAASGAVLGAQIAGPVGALVAGIGGAVIGGIQGFFSAKNQQILINALEKIASTTGELDIALKNLAQTANDVNFKNAQKAFGDVIQASGDIRSLALGSSTLTAGDAGGIAGTAVAGAIGGAVAGAIAGSVVPVIGTAVGAAIGGAIGGIAGGSYGFFNRPSAAQRQEALGALVNQAGKQQDIASRFAERDLGKLNVDQLMKLYDELNAGTSEFNPIAQQYVDSMLAAAAAAQQAKTGSDVLTAAQKQEITTTALNTAALDSYMRARKEAGATDEQISKEINADRAQAIKIGQYYNDENAKLLAKQAALAKATQVLANEFSNLDDVFNRVGSFTDRFKAELEQLDVDIQARVGDLTGKSEVQKSDRKFERVLSNISAYSPEEVSQAANFAATLGGGGEQAVALANTANLARVFQNQLPQLIKASADFAGDDREDVRGREGVVAELQRQLTAAVARPDRTVSTGAQTAIKEIMDQARGELDSGKPVDASNFEKLSTTLNNGAQQLQKFVSTYYDLLDKAIQYQNQYNTLISQSAEALRKANIVGISAELDLAKVFDRDLSLDQLNAPFEAGIRDLTSSLVAGGSTDPQEIAGAIQDKQAELVQKRGQRQGIQDQIAALGAANPQNEVEFERLQAETKALINEEGDLSRAINDGSQALDQLASDGTRASNALSKIAAQRERSKAVGDLTEKLLTGSAADVQETQFRAAGLRAALANPTKLQSRQTRQDAFGGLADLQGILKPEQFNKIRADLLEGSLKAQGIKLTDELISGTSWEEVLADIRGQDNQEDPQVQAYRDAIQAQKTAGEKIAESIRKAAEQLKIPDPKQVDFNESVKGIDEFFRRMNSDYPTIVERAYAAVTADLENIKTAAEEARKRDAEAGVASPPPKPRAEPEGIDTTKSESYKSKVAGLFGAEVTGYGGAAVDAAGAAIVAGAAVEGGRRIYRATGIPQARAEAAKVREVEAAQRKDRIKAETKRLRAEDPNLGKEEAKAKAARTVDEQIKAEKRKGGRKPSTKTTTTGPAQTAPAAAQATAAATQKPTATSGPPRRQPGAPATTPQPSPPRRGQAPTTTVPAAAQATAAATAAPPAAAAPAATQTVATPAATQATAAAAQTKPATSAPPTGKRRAQGPPSKLPQPKPSVKGGRGVKFRGRAGRAAGVAGLAVLGLAAYGGYRYIADERKRLEEEKKYSDDALAQLTLEAQEVGLDTSSPEAKQQLADINAAAITAGKSAAQSPEFMAQDKAIREDKTLTEDERKKKLQELADSAYEQDQRVRDIGITSLQLQQQGATGTPAEIQAQARAITELSAQGKTEEAQALFDETLGIAPVKQEPSDSTSTTAASSSTSQGTASTSTESEAGRIAAETLAMSEAVMNITNATLNIENLSSNGLPTIPFGSQQLTPQALTPQALTAQVLSNSGFVPQPEVSVVKPEPVDMFAGASERSAAEAEAEKQRLNAEERDIQQQTTQGVVDTGTSLASYTAATAALTPVVGQGAAVRGSGLQLGVGLARTGLDALGVPEAIGERGTTGREVYETGADLATAGAVLAGGAPGIAINTAADAFYTGAELIRDPRGKVKQWDESTTQLDNIENAGLVMGSLQNASAGFTRPIDTIGQGVTQTVGLMKDTAHMVDTALAAARAESRASEAISGSFSERGASAGVDVSAVSKLTETDGVGSIGLAKDIAYADTQIQILEDLLTRGFDLQQVSQLAEGTDIGLAKLDLQQLETGFGIDTLEELIAKRKETRAGFAKDAERLPSGKKDLFNQATSQITDLYLAESRTEMDRLGLSAPQPQSEAQAQASSQLMDASLIFSSIDPNILLNIGVIIAQGFAAVVQQLFPQKDQQKPSSQLGQQASEASTENSDPQAISAIEDMATKATKPGSIYTHDTRAEALLQQLVNNNSSSTSTPDVTKPETAEPTNLNDAVIEANKQMLQARGKITEYNQGLQGAPEDIQAYQDAKAKLEGLQAMQAQRQQLALKSPTPPSTQAITTNDKKPSDQITQTAPTQQTPAVTESQARIAEQPVVDNPLGITRVSEDSEQSTPTITSKPMNRRQSMLAQRRANYLQNKESRRQAYLATLSPERRAKIAEAEKKKQDAELLRARKLELKQSAGEKLTKPQQQLVDKYKPQIEMEARKIEEASNTSAEETQSNVADIGTDRIDFALGGGDIDQAIAIQQRADAARKEREEAGKARAQQVLANNAVPVSPTQGAPTTNFAASSAGGPSMQNLGAQPINTAFLNNVTAAETGVQQTQQTGGPDNSLIYSLSLDDKSTEILNSFNKTLSETLGGFGQNFENYISRLESLTFTHKLEGEYNINVNFTGEAPLKALNDTMKQLAEDLVMPEIEKLRGEIKNAGMDLRTRGSPGG